MNKLAKQLSSSVSIALKKAKKLQMLNQHDEAREIYIQILEKYPKNRSAIAGLAASNNLKSVRPEDPPPQTLVFLQEIYSSGDFDQVIELSDRLAHQYPESAALSKARGAAYASLGQIDLAIQHYDRVLADNINDAEMLFAKGLIQYKKADFREAYLTFSKLLTLDSKNAKVYNELGRCELSLGRLKEAQTFFQQSLKYDPTHVNALINLASAYRRMEMIAEALQSCLDALNIDPDSIIAKMNFADMLSSVRFTNAPPAVEETLNDILNVGHLVRPKNIVNAVLSFLRHKAPFAELKDFSVHNLSPSQAVNIAKQLNQEDLFLKLASVCPLNDLELEALMKGLRLEILNVLVDNGAVCGILKFQSALALQAFCNEYVYSCTSQEQKLVGQLNIRVSNELTAGGQPDPGLVLCLASYQPLHSYEWSHRLVPVPEIKDVLMRTLEDQVEERLLASEMESFSEPVNKISSKVRDQYEQNPYPRWINLRLEPYPHSLSTILAKTQCNLLHPLGQRSGSLDVLIAGCGTGQQAIEISSMLTSANITALDLSKTSLAYAQRKTKEFEIANLTYTHGDILDLKRLSRNFDVIYCEGVLHHMEDPIEGWATLVNHLKPAGLMQIGLYSTLARRHIARFRSELELDPEKIDSQKLREHRDMIAESKEPHHQWIRQGHDFYSLSTFRDLLFHVQEHTFTIQQISTYLNCLGLHFCGFSKPEIRESFKREYPDAADMHDLVKWAFFEEKYPHAFAGMYSFWCQKM